MAATPCATKRTDPAPAAGNGQRPRTVARGNHATNPVDAAMAAFAARAPALPIAVAYSGGADSTALLHACAQRWPNATLAWHVHHGLQAAADDFERHCRATCAQLHIPIAVAHIDARARAGESPEDAARSGRYRAYDALAGAANPLGRPATVVLAQHADDQVETLLIALLRGAGLPGLAAMPRFWERGGLHYARPLLAVPRAAIRAWLAERDIAWIEDPTNADTHYLRNRIRHTVLPALEAIAPSFHTTFARSAAHAAEAETLLAALAAQDLALAGDPPRIAALQPLDDARLANALRHWLRTAAGHAPSSAQLTELQHQIRRCTTCGHHIRLRAAGGWVVRDGATLRWARTIPDA